MARFLTIWKKGAQVKDYKGLKGQLDHIKHFYLMMLFPIDAFSLDKPASVPVRCLRTKGSFYQPNMIEAGVARHERHAEKGIWLSGDAGGRDMKQGRMVLLSSCLMFLLSLTLSYYPAYGTPEKAITAGEILPEFTLSTPGSKEAQQYLGLTNATPFSISELPAKLCLVEIFSTICTVCIENAPVMNKLYKFIQSDEILCNDIKMLGIGVGDNEKRINVWRTKFRVPFPLFPDPKRVIHKKFGLVATPYTILVNHSGKVLYAHGGHIEDVEKFFVMLKKFQKQQ